MNATAEDIVMSHQLTPAKQNAMLSQCDWVGDSKVKVVCMHRTEPLLRAAGVHTPRAMEGYLIPVKRDKSGFLVIDHEKRAESESVGELFEPGGLLYGMERVDEGDDSPPVGSEAITEAIKEFVHDFKSGIHARRFEVPTGARNTKVRVIVVALEDRSRPEPPPWKDVWEPRDASDTEVHVACMALTAARDLKDYEQ